MEDANYIILMDENGQPYIEHASLREVGQRIAGAASSAAQGVGRGVRQNAKYIQKIVDNGKTRYFYTQDELKAYYNRGRQSAQNAYNNARANVQRTAQNVQSRARNFSSNARASAERSYNEARNRFNTTRNNVRSAVDQGTRQAQSLVDQANARARETYRNVRDQSANQINQARGAVNEGISRGRETLQNAVNEGKRKAEKAASDLKEGKLLDRAFDKIEASEKKRLSKFKGADLYDRLQKLESKGQLSESEGKEYNRLVEEWKKSPHAEEMTKSINAQQRGYDTVKSVSDKISKVKQITESEADKLRQKYNEAKDLTQDEMNELFDFLMKNYKK